MCKETNNNEDASIKKAQEMQAKTDQELERLANQGDADAMYELGYRNYFDNKHKDERVGRDIACNWWCQAVKHGHEGAKQKLKDYCQWQDFAKQTLEEYCGEKED